MTDEEQRRRGVLRVATIEDVETMTAGGWELVEVRDCDVVTGPNHNGYGMNPYQVDAAKPHAVLRRPVFVLSMRADRRMEEMQQQLRSLTNVVRTLEENARAAEQEKERLRNEAARSVRDHAAGLADVQRAHQEELRMMMKVFSLSEPERAAVEAIARLGDPDKVLGWLHGQRAAPR